ncbi:hypothetical protein VTI74DRAFT_5835 [Chaetomium olivicolor]
MQGKDKVRSAMYRHTNFIAEERIEDVERYAPGGYHPVDIGDIIANGEDTYIVAHKLGSGGFSTVWLAKRQRKGSTGQQLPLSFHALKILRADLGERSADHELRFLQSLGQVGRYSHRNIVMLEDSFTISGSNGRHCCLVLPLLGLSLYSQRTRNLTPSQRRNISQQLASAVAFLHSHDVCHGDLTPSNIAFAIPGAQSMTETRLMEFLGPVRSGTLQLRKGPVAHSEHAPQRVVAPASFSGLDIASLATVQIIDFGCAFFSNSPPPVLGCPVEYYPPELIFGYPVSAKCDVWQLAAILFYTYTSHHMFFVGFQAWKDRFVWDKYVMAKPGDVVKPVPLPDWWFDDKQPKKPFEDRITKGASYLSATQRKELVRLLSDMVAWEPAFRISAAEADRRLRSFVLSSIRTSTPVPKSGKAYHGYTQDCQEEDDDEDDEDDEVEGRWEMSSRIVV